MPKVSALRLVEAAILPAIIIIATKLLALFVASLIFGISWEFNLAAFENNFLVFQYSSQSDLSTVINFSDMLVVLVCSAGFTWALFQAHHLNIDKTHPTLISKIYNKGRQFWLTTTGRVDHLAAVWLGLLWLVFFMVLVDVYQCLTSQFVLGVALAVTIGLTFAFYEFAKSR